MPWVELLPHINASLNALAGVLLVIGFVLIKRRNETAHKWAMLSAFSVSVIFFACYVTYHYYAGSREFPKDTGAVWYVYIAILASHVVLAATVPFLAVTVIVLGLRDKRDAHRRWARVTFPIWLYVSVTGVIVYLMLYQLYRPADEPLSATPPLAEQLSSSPVKAYNQAITSVQPILKS